MVLRDELMAFFRAGVAAAGAARTLPAVLPTGPATGRTIVLGCGKAAGAMAEVAARHLEGDITGCVVTRYGHGPEGNCGPIRVIEASHPVPDAASLRAGTDILALAQGATAGDRVIFLVSGGGSALLSAPIEGVSLADKAAITRHLVHSGAAIGEINLVRRHLSRVKGGRLAAAAASAGQLHSFIISDVPDDDPAKVASGPSIAAPFEPDQALAVLADSGWPVTPTLADAVRCSPPPLVTDHPVHVIATAKTALAAVSAAARAAGWQVIDLGDAIEGDAAATGRVHAAMAMTCAAMPGRHLLLSGGELTVDVHNPDGRGGPNLEYLTGLMATLPIGAPVAALACDSDGIDGSEDNAGGYVDALHRATAEQCDAALSVNRSYDLFRDLGGLVITGPTRTNVNDIRMIAVEGSA